MATYLALVHKDADSVFGLSFPDLPGCHSAAEDADGLFPQAQAALALWLAHEPRPEPRSFEAIHAEVAGELHKGAFLIAVPAPAERQG
jgi:predicted RNase H-like HicB family nuclease